VTFLSAELLRPLAWTVGVMLPKLDAWRVGKNPRVDPEYANALRDGFELGRYQIGESED
jgi:hypothetical protein